MPIREKLDFSFSVLNPTSDPIKTKDTERNEKIKAYTESELALYRSMSNTAEDFAKISKFWRGIANPDGTTNSAYGWLIWKDKSCGNPEFEPGAMRTPWEWAVQALQQDRDTRQAVLKFHHRRSLWVGCKDQICTMHGMFTIRGGMLNLSMVMRSNDVVKGTVFDVPFFVSLQEMMLSQLRPTYPELKLGIYSHFAHSMHLYEKDLETAKRMLGDESRNFVP